jgi:hypothetical protein
VRQLLAFAIQLPSAKDGAKDMKMKNLKLIMAASIGFSGIGLAAQPASATSSDRHFLGYSNER